MTFTVLSKRKLLQLVKEKYVNPGTIPGCQRFQVFDGGVIHPKVSGNLQTGSAFKKEIT